MANDHQVMKDCMTHCFGTETAPGPNFQHVCTGYCDVTPYCSDTGGGCNVVTICFGNTCLGLQSQCSDVTDTLCTRQSMSR